MSKKIPIEDRVKAILKYHKERIPGVKIVKVTTTRYYEIPSSHSEPINDLLEEWFKKYPVSRTHAFRDQSLLIDHFNNDAKIIE